jgi:hypothetical protein
MPVTVPKFCIFPKIYNLTSMYGPTASGAGVDPILQLLWPATLVLPIAGN